jgi:hypothetical protein
LLHQTSHQSWKSRLLPIDVYLSTRIVSTAETKFVWGN